MKVLSTKKLDDALIATYTQRGLEITCVEMLRATPVACDATDIDATQYDAIAFTSSHAVAHAMKDNRLTALCQTKMIYALSGKTKDTLAQHGIYTTAGADNAESLSALIAQNKAIHSILHLTGNLTLDTLGTRLTEAGISYHALEVYRTDLIGPVVTDPYDAILFFSPSGVDSYLLHNVIKSTSICCCIGPTTASHLRERITGINLLVPAAPTPEQMLHLLSNYHPSDTHDR